MTIDARAALEKYASKWLAFTDGSDDAEREEFAPAAFAALRAVLDECDRAWQGPRLAHAIRIAIADALEGIDHA